MTPEAWLAAAGGAALAALVTYVTLRARQGREAVARSLVPRRTRQLMGALSSGAIIVRRDRRAAFSNATASALGLARPDGALDESVADLAERAWEQGEAVEEEISIRRGVLGAVATVHVRVSPLDEDLALAVANDSTDQRAAELTRREFAVNVSHELKTPVGALALLAETIDAAADEPDTVREFAAKIGKESRRLSKLIQEIIEISRLQGGESVMDHQEVKIGEVIVEAVEAAKLAAEARNIDVTVTEKAKASVMGDRDLLVMALRNLVDNAIAYSDAGGRVSIDTALDGSIVTLSVIDRGIGIAASEQERIFERFFRTDPARSRDSGGTGLGLSIVKHVALQHAGDVSVWSRIGIGSTFALRLPVHKVKSS